MFYMHWETKKFVWLTLPQHLLYCGGWELNPPYLQGIPAQVLIIILCYNEQAVISQEGENFIFPKTMKKIIQDKKK